MIIVSQDKEIVITYENVEALGVGNPLENNNGLFPIIANVISDNQYILGGYETEERAKEILQEIVNHYYNYELTKVYEMPKEQKMVKQRKEEEKMGTNYYAVKRKPTISDNQYIQENQVWGGYSYLEHKIILGKYTSWWLCKL